MTTEERLRKALRQLAARLDAIVAERERLQPASGMTQHNRIGHFAALRSLARYADTEASK